MAVLMAITIFAGIPMVVSFAMGGMLVLSGRLGKSTEHTKTIGGSMTQADVDDEQTGSLTGQRSCMHCVEAPCVKSCPSEALCYDEYEFVVYEPEKCTLGMTPGRSRISRYEEENRQRDNQ
jgi:ferredoxin